VGKRILIIGNGAREHALAWAVAQSHDVEKIFVMPGNGGTAGIAQNISIENHDIDRVINFVREAGVTFTIVGPEDWLEWGIVDEFQARDLPIFGPTREAARIETSKGYAKFLMHKFAVPTGEFMFCKDANELLFAVTNFGFPCVIKADGLARGKGVFVCHEIKEVDRAVEGIFVQKQFGRAGDLALVEEFILGEEVSIHVLTDGTNVVFLPSSQDHKPLRENDEGPNTGGMGAIAPVPWLTQEHLKTIEETIIRPTLDGLSAEGRPFTGCLYAGLKMTDEGPRVLEFNARFGDPEACVILPLIKHDFIDLLEAVVNGRLNDIHGEIVQTDATAATIVLASSGYPEEKMITGMPLSGIEDATAHGVRVFHAGTVQNDCGLATSGGRVLDVTAWGQEPLAATLAHVYDAVHCISFEGMQFRRDIGAKALRRSSL